MANSTSSQAAEEGSYYLQLNKNPIRFEPVSKVTNVFFDDSNKQVRSSVSSKYFANSFLIFDIAFASNWYLTIYYQTFQVKYLLNFQKLYLYSPVSVVFSD